VVCSRDGEFVYTTSGRFDGDSGLSAFRRKATGELQLVGELLADEGDLSKFIGGNRLVLSPDERNIYAVATRSGVVACFSRDLKTGQIKLAQIFGSSPETGPVAGAAGISISPDGKFVYIAAEEPGAISIYRRE